MSIPAFVDSHVHFWDLQRFHYPWLEGPGIERLKRDFTPNDLAAEATGLKLTGVVHVQAEVDHASDPALETAWLEELRLQSPRGILSACVGYADLRAPDLEAVLARHCAYALFRGIRQEAWYDPQSQRADIPRTNLLADSNWVRGLKTLVRHDLSFDLLIWPHQLPQAAEIFGNEPTLPVALEHTGLPPLHDAEGMRQWRQGLERFAAAVPRSVLKLSGVHHATPGWSFAHHAASTRRAMREAIDIFGPDRCMFASDFPVISGASAYFDLWSTYDQTVSDFSESERHALFAGVATRFYHLSMAPASTGNATPVR